MSCLRFILNSFTIWVPFNKEKVMMEKNEEWNEEEKTIKKDFD